MSNEKKKSNQAALLGAAFLMATSAIGPGFLTQTVRFTDTLKGSFGFVILISLLLSAFAQVNIWRVLCVSGLRGQDVANKLLPGLGYVVSILVVIGGLVFNIGNVGGAGLGFTTVFFADGAAISPLVYILCGAIAIMIFLSKNAKGIMDQLVKILGAVMIVVILIVIFVVHPPVGNAIKNTFVPEAEFSSMVPTILTLMGGTVGGYITFAGAHRLIDAGVTGEKNLGEIRKTALMGMIIAAVVRVLLFLAVLGVVVIAAEPLYQDATNPVASVFRDATAGLANGEIGRRFAGVVLLCAAITSIIGAAYTSVSFLKTFSKWIDEHENIVIICFIALSTIIMAIVNTTPASLLVIAGAVNGLILPITLAVCLVAAKSKKVMGTTYKHPMWLWTIGWAVVAISGYLGVTTFVKQLSSLL